jgi:hypothetical protein
VIYHLFVAEDNSTELFAQAQRIHGLMPYSILKNILRFSNPIAMLRGLFPIMVFDDRCIGSIPGPAIWTEKSSPEDSEHDFKRRYQEIAEKYR